MIFIFNLKLFPFFKKIRENPSRGRKGREKRRGKRKKEEEKRS